MRDIERIDKFLAKVGEIWKRECPDWRFGQLLYNFIDEDPFHWEENTFIQKLENYFKKDL